MRRSVSRRKGLRERHSTGTTIATMMRLRWACCSNDQLGVFQYTRRGPLVLQDRRLFLALPAETCQDTHRERIVPFPIFPQNVGCDWVWPRDGGGLEPRACPEPY